MSEFVLSLRIDRLVFLQELFKYYVGTSFSACTRDNLVPVLENLIRNGVLMNPHGISHYLECPMTDTLDLLEKHKKNIPAILHDTEYGFNYYLRSDIWKFSQIFIDHIHKSQKTYRLRYNDTLLDSRDISFYYGIPIERVTSVILRKIKIPMIPVNSKIRGYRQNFIACKDLFQACRHPVFFQEIEYSPIPVSCYAIRSVNTKESLVRYNENPEIFSFFRNDNCPEYHRCSDFALRNTDYMNCNYCPKISKYPTPYAMVFINPCSTKHHNKILKGKDLPNQKGNVICSS